MVALPYPTQVHILLAHRWPFSIAASSWTVHREERVGRSRQRDHLQEIGAHRLSSSKLAGPENQSVSGPADSRSLVVGERFIARIW